MHKNNIKSAIKQSSVFMERAEMALNAGVHFKSIVK